MILRIALAAFQAAVEIAGNVASGFNEGTAPLVAQLQRERGRLRHESALASSVHEAIDNL